MQRIGSGFFWNQLNTLYVREGACKVRVDGQKTNLPLNNPSHQGLGDSPDPTLHKPLPSAGSGDRLELNSKAELNLPGSSSADEVTNYSEVAAPEGCPW